MKKDENCDNKKRVWEGEKIVDEVKKIRSRQLRKGQKGREEKKVGKGGGKMKGQCNWKEN